MRGLTRCFSPDRWSEPARDAILTRPPYRCRVPSLARLGACLILVALLAPVWIRSAPAVRAARLDMVIVPVAPPDADRQRAMLGPFRLTGTWQLLSNWRSFGGYSALIAQGGDRLVAISDTGHALAFAPPDRPWFPPVARDLTGPGPDGANDVKIKFDRDFESASRDAATGRFWIGAEYTNRILRFGADGRLQAAAAPPAMARWPINSGAETLVRLRDGRFIVLCECTRAHSAAGDLHTGLLFARDPAVGPPPPVRFSVRGPATFAPVDAAQLPDGRVLVLMRTLVWPMPQRFAGRLMIADPARITAGGIWDLRQVASLGTSLHGDNFEGMAIAPGAAGRLAIWVISDDNQSRFQKTLLWRLEVDPARL